ncbi:hypothetical protein [Micromonospora humi]|uniref:Uncharacterized protein n=1 Tax=Micromonospora humi TaxID=745366 RepID=A0A1C5JQ67_9ACTN|nr:hypothetical protein [Micromonospora humi]SCG72725.1 hypothetical protein GA0070213_112249 [Micromonospora humi]
MPRRPLLLIAAAACAALHVAGVLVAHPVWRGAEVLCLALLLAYAVAGGLRAPRWAAPAALAVLLVDAIRTMPAAPGDGDFGWRVVDGNDPVDVTAGVEAGLTAGWAALAATVLLLVGWRGRLRRRPTVLAGVVALPVVGYAAVRVAAVRHDLAGEDGPLLSGPALTDVTSAVVLAVLPALALAVAASALAALLAGRGRWLAAAGGAVLALVALPLIDASLDAVPLPLSAGDGTALFAWHAITPTSAMPQPVAALTVAVELTAYLLLFAGLTGADRDEPAVPVPVAG